MKSYQVMFSITLLLCCHESEFKRAKHTKPKVKAEDEFTPVKIEYLTIRDLTDSYEVPKDNYYSDIKGLSIENSNLSHVPIRLLNEFVSLEELTLKGNTIINFKIERLNSAQETMSKNVQHLRIEKQNLGMLLNESFMKYRNLNTLHLICTSIHTIEQNAFRGLAKLLILDLTGNNLRVLRSGTLLPLESLEVLSLRSNQFQFLEDIFGRTIQPRLRILHMENNLLKGINYLELMEMCPSLKRYEYCIGHKKPCEREEDVCTHI